MKIAQTYKDFSKIKRKYYKRNTIKRIDHFDGKRFVSYWEKDDWIGYTIPSFLTYSTNKSISKEIKLLIGEEDYNETLERVKFLYDVSFSEKLRFHVKNYQNNIIERNGYFAGVIITNRDAYYLVNTEKYSKDKKDYKLVPMFWYAEKINEK
jgi:hypothetical protein